MDLHVELAAMKSSPRTIASAVERDEIAPLTPETRPVAVTLHPANLVRMIFKSVEFSLRAGIPYWIELTDNRSEIRLLVTSGPHRSSP